MSDADTRPPRSRSEQPTIKKGDIPPEGSPFAESPASRRATRDFLQRAGMPIPPELLAAIAADEAAGKT